VFQLGSAIGIAIAVAVLGIPAAGEVAPYARTWAIGGLGALACALVVTLAYPARRQDL
jgi:hypothetical protein